MEKLFRIGGERAEKSTAGQASFPKSFTKQTSSLGVHWRVINKLSTSGVGISIKVEDESENTRISLTDATSTNELLSLNIFSLNNSIRQVFLELSNSRVAGTQSSSSDLEILQRLQVKERRSSGFRDLCRANVKES